MSWLFAGACGLAWWFAGGLLPRPFDHVHWLLLVLGFYVVVQDQGSPPAKGKEVVLQLEHLVWTLEEFCRHWFVSGKTGSGKTSLGLTIMVVQLCQNVEKWGGIFLDQKGDLWKILVAVFASFKIPHRLVLLKVRSQFDPPDWQPVATTNLIEDNNVLAETIAETIVDTACSLGVASKEGNGGHFVSLAGIAIANGIEALRVCAEPCTLPGVYEMLSNEDEMSRILDRMEEIGRFADKKGHEAVARHAMKIHTFFRLKFLTIDPEQLSGVKTSLQNMLYFFCQDDIAQVFCSEKPTFRMRDVDQGRVICISVPQRFKKARQFVNTIMKLNFFDHGFQRFDRGEAYCRKCCLLVGAFDESQRLLSKNELGGADHATVDQLRAAKVALIYLTQTERSYHPRLGEPMSNTLIDNLSNELVFTQTNKPDATKIADRLGEHEVEIRSRTVTDKGPGSRNYNKKVEHLVKPHLLRSPYLKKGEVYVRHCEKGHLRTRLTWTNFTKPLKASEEAYDAERDEFVDVLNPLYAGQQLLDDLDAAQDDGKN